MSNVACVTSRLRIGLGTFVSVEAESDQAQCRARGVATAYEAVALVETLMHPMREGSDVAAINAAVPKSTLTVHVWTWTILELCQRLHRLSAGVFDPCVPNGPGTLADLELLPGRAGRSPRVVPHAPVHLDLGGIGKGFAVDRAIEALKRAGCSAGLVNAGGDLALYGECAQDVAYRNRDGRLTMVALHNAALATSDVDGRERPAEHRGYYDAGDPQRVVSGRATVRAPTAAVADALTKCLLIGRGSQHALLAAFDAQQLG